MKDGVAKFAGGATAAAAVAVILATAFSQHPNRAFDRFRRFDRIGFWLPNWRFFAPEPAMADYHILHRVLDADDDVSPWIETHVIAPRKLSHVLWFPDRRVDKGVFDATSELLGLLPHGEATVLASPAYQLMVGFVRARIDREPHPPLSGFQFLIARAGGYDPEMEPEEMLTSPFVPWERVHPVGAQRDEPEQDEPERNDSERNDTQENDTQENETQENETQGNDHDA